MTASRPKGRTASPAKQGPMVRLRSEDGADDAPPLNAMAAA
ncbi:MAG: hypothetical protein ACYC2H_00840 [Thermoplasmatota archaeon]